MGELTLILVQSRRWVYLASIQNRDKKSILQLYILFGIDNPSLKGWHQNFAFSSRLAGTLQAALAD